MRMRDTLAYVVDYALIVGALGTAGALVIAALSYKGSAKDRKRSQASKVFAVPLSTKASKGSDGAWFWEPFDATITNKSDAPVWDISISLHDVDGERVTGRVFWVSMPESESSSVNFPRSKATQAGEELPVFGSPRLHLEFTDNAGIRWARTPEGKLNEVPR